MHQHLQSARCCEMRHDDHSTRPKLVANMAFFNHEQVEHTDASVCAPPPASIVAVEPRSWASEHKVIELTEMLGIKIVIELGLS